MSEALPASPRNDAVARAYHQLGAGLAFSTDRRARPGSGPSIRYPPDWLSSQTVENCQKMLAGLDQVTALETEPDSASRTRGVRDPDSAGFA